MSVEAGAANLGRSQDPLLAGIDAVIAENGVGNPGVYSGNLTFEERVAALTGEPLTEAEAVPAELDPHATLRNRQLLGTMPLNLAARLAMGIPLPATLSTHKTEDVVDL